MPRRPHPLAVATAKQLISGLGVRDPADIKIELIAAHHNVFVKRRRLDHEEGRLLRTHKTGLIVVDDRAFASSKWRFVVAHELGHYLRHATVDQFNVCTDANLATYVGSGREAEANDFAAELLMPEALFKKECDRNRPSLRDISEIAARFETSLTATALRFVMFSPEPCAVVHSTAGIVDWLDWSTDFKLGIKKGTRLTTNTYAGDLHVGKPADDRLQQVDGDGWSDNLWARDIDLFEHSKRVGSEAVLTLLWHPFR